MKRALFIVDVQLDFCPGGNLAVPFGDKVVPIINKLIDSKKFDLIIASKDNRGNDFHPDLKLKNIHIFTKCVQSKSNKRQFSGFVGVNDYGECVEEFLKEMDEIYVVGLSGDYGVKETAIDCSMFFKTYFVVDATRFIGDITVTLEEISKDGIIIANSDDCLRYYLSNDKYYQKDNIYGLPF